MAALVCAPLPLLDEPASAEAAEAATEAATTAQQTSGARSEIVSERTESTTTWANADGTTTAPGAPGGLASSTHPVTTSAYADRTTTFNWSAPTDLSGQKYYSGDLTLYRVESGSSASARIYKGGKTSSSSRPVHDYWRRWAQSGDMVCTGGMMTGEMCGWKVTDTQATIRYSGGTTAKNMVVAKKTSGSCTIKGDSGGPVYTVDGSGRAFTKGIISGGGGGGDNSGGLFDPCWLYFTDIGLANSAFPGTVARY